MNLEMRLRGMAGKRRCLSCVHEIHLVIVRSFAALKGMHLRIFFKRVKVR